MPAGKGRVVMLAVDRRRLVRRQYFECRPHVRNRGERLRDRHEAPRVEGWHQGRILAACESSHDLDDHGIAWLENPLRALRELSAFLERSQERGEVGGAQHAEGVLLFERASLVTVVEVVGQ